MTDDKITALETAIIAHGIDGIFRRLESSVPRALTSADLEAELVLMMGKAKELYQGKPADPAPAVRSSSSGYHPASCSCMNCFNAGISELIRRQSLSTKDALAARILANQQADTMPGAVWVDFMDVDDNINRRVCEFMTAWKR